MANQPHPSKKAVTWRLDRALVADVKAEAARRGETVLALVTRALSREVGRRTDLPERTPNPEEGT